MQRILLTGSSGLIGARLAHTLVQQGHRVVGIDKEYDDGDAVIKARRLAALRKLDDFEYHKVDITDEKALSEVVRMHEYSATINLAAYAGVRQSRDNPPEFFRNNLVGNVILLEEVCKAGIKKYLVASSSSVYGDSGEAFSKEDDPVNEPMSPYATTKCCTELTSRTHQVMFDMDMAVMRFFTTYGPWGRPNMLMTRVVKWVVEGEPVAVLGDGSASRSFIYVDDLVDGIIAMLDRAKGYQTYNLGGAQRVSVNDVIATVERMTGRKADVRHLPGDPADAPHSLADISRAKAELDWEPKVDIKTGIGRLVEWYMEHRSWLKEAIPSPSLP